MCHIYEAVLTSSLMNLGNGNNGVDKCSDITLAFWISFSLNGIPSFLDEHHVRIHYVRITVTPMACSSAIYI